MELEEIYKQIEQATIDLCPKWKDCAAERNMRNNLLKYIKLNQEKEARIKELEEELQHRKAAQESLNFVMTEDEYVWAILERYGGMEESYHCAMYNELLEQNRQLKRALWLARAERASDCEDKALLDLSNPQREILIDKWQVAQRKCRAKADEFLTKEQK